MLSLCCSLLTQLKMIRYDVFHVVMSLRLVFLLHKEHTDLGNNTHPLQRAGLFTELHLKHISAQYSWKTA